MVLCLLALPLFAILGLFSLKYRQLAKDALECLFSTVTFRKCKSSLDDRIKSQLTGKILKHFPGAAKYFYQNYRLFSWIILILFLWSTYTSGVGLYNFYYYGNCNGPEETGFCVFDPLGTNSKISEIDYVAPEENIMPELEEDDPIIGNPAAELTIIEFGCYACPYTKKAEPVVEKILDYYDGRVNFQFKTLKIPHHHHSYTTALAANCAQDQGKYLEFHEILFEMQEELGNVTLSDMAKMINLNIEEFNECMETEKYKMEVDSDTLMGFNAGVFGTPTFFINEQRIVGPKPFKTFKKIIDGELKK